MELFTNHGMVANLTYLTLFSFVEPISLLNGLWDVVTSAITCSLISN